MEDTRWLTVERLKLRLGVDGVTLSEGDTARMESALRAAQAEIEAATGRRYVPVRRTLSHWVRAGQQAAELRDDLLELEAVTDADGTVHLPQAVTWDAGCVMLKDGAVFTGGEVRVTGLWAWHPAPLQAFRASGDAPIAGVNASAATFNVGDAGGEDALGESPRFAPGQIIRLDDELMRVTAVTGDTLTVRRGENGTTAASHSSSTPIPIFIPGDRALALGLRLASWLYREPDAEHGRDWPRGVEHGIRTLQRVRV